MSNSIVGNNGTPTDFLSWFETEIDEDEYEDMEGELVDEENIFGRRGIVPKNSNSTTVTVFYYYYAPTSEWYWDYSYGVNYKPVIPVVFAADANWNLTQCLNASFSETSFTGQANGWKALNVTLTRKLVEGERIVFGVYSDLINQQRNIFNDYEICLYLQYENEPDGFFYTRSVIGNAGLSASFTGRQLGAYRVAFNVAAFFDSSVRILCKRFLKSENLVVSDSAQKLLLLIRSIFISFGASDGLSRKTDFRKSVLSSIENEEKVLRLGENFRRFEDVSEIEARPFASRMFYRAIETVMNLWDWLRGKIREANNVVTFFCPIATEITLECKI